jgi:hypothetical protein
MVAVMFGAVHRGEGIGYRPPWVEYDLFLKRTMSLLLVYTVDQLSLDIELQGSSVHVPARNERKRSTQTIGANTEHRIRGRLPERRKNLKRDGVLGGH